MTTTLRHDPLIDYLKRLDALEKTINLLDWDTKVGLPDQSHQERSFQLANLTKIHHAMSVDTQLKRLLDEYKPLSSTEERLLYLARKNYNLATQFPEGFSEEFALTTSQANASWQTARAHNDHTLFLSDFVKVVQLVRQKAEYTGYTNHPYDALLSEFDEDLTTQKIQNITSTLQPALQDILKTITRDNLFTQPLPITDVSTEAQRKFASSVIQTFGFDLSRGREDDSLHPFTTTLGASDVRITSHYKESSLLGIFASFHEAGHGIYNQNIAPHFSGIPLGHATSLSIHESQSRLWENLVGKSYEFWTHYFPVLQKELPEALSSYSLDQFYHAINYVAPSTIRVEADEVTYNLHIMLRTTLEIQLVEGTLSPEDIHTAWQQAAETFLGVSPRDDNSGFLQDIHWSAGYFGYFPTYMIGNLTASQLFATITQEHDLKTHLSNGYCGELYDWLLQNVHQYGSLYTSDELLQKITHSSLKSHYFIDYLQQKYLKTL